MNIVGLDDHLKLNLKVALAGSMGAAVLYTLMQSWGFDLVVISDVLFVLVSGVCTFFGVAGSVEVWWPRKVWVGPCGVIPSSFLMVSG